MSWPEIDPELQNTAADALGIRQVSGTDPRQRHRHLRGSLGIEPVKPGAKGALAPPVKVF
jgi:hypothetical protein